MGNVMSNRKFLEDLRKNKRKWLAHENSSHVPNAVTKIAMEEAKSGIVTSVTLDELRSMIDEACKSP